MQDLALQALIDQVQQAAAAATPLRIQGGNTKAFYGEEIDANQILSTRELTGISNYEPTELVITAR
jgi:glycolate oxidase FAD binding subunit